MDFIDVLKPTLIKIDMVEDTKEAVLEELAKLLKKEDVITSKKEYLEAVYKRELEAPTGIGNAIAIPHGKDKSIKEASVAIAKLKSPIAWESLDDKPVSLVFLLAIPEENKKVEHLKLLSQLAQKLSREETFHDLNAVKTEMDMIKVFQN
ncbi:MULTISPECIES: PTS sugar transporter subunit IIA [unclassified Bacillus (in: firmicutes)]|uniref:PTS sugar transporter subunit IIA n=1 Tax=unclassified Bacillus (in: firmicutes) TaxID=185979 RepID=UPI0004E1FB1C|nr:MULTISPECIES: fructose PTS transporter subunit IIA [unclassified Bacillus (in: firmicutes)]